VRSKPGAPALVVGSAASAPAQTTFTVDTRGPGLHEITQVVAAWVRGNGLLTLFVRHTSCSLLIQENADPDVRTDLEAFFRRLVPRADDPAMGYLRHRAEGPDDMPAHIRAAMLPVSLSIPVTDGRLALGTWQGIYLFEHRDRPHRREVAAHLA
jgi:secondary thiamine-phosphate synthase enzyme